MDYFAHIDGERKQSVLEHSEGVARLAGMFAGEFGKYEWGYCSGMLHDIGKYSLRFQRRLQKGDVQVDHSTAGAQLCAAKGGYYSFLNYCIAGHHAGLPDCGSNTDNGGESTLSGRLKKKIEDYQAYQSEIEVPLLHSAPIDPKAVPNPYFSLSVFMRMIYSCLVDADYLDTERFMQPYKLSRGGYDGMERLLGKLEKHIEKWANPENEMNKYRWEILSECLRCGEKTKGIYTLTVPTGGGKTVSSMAFALRHAVAHGMKHIIYVIPYTSIIEQNAAVFKEILGEDNVLEHHSGKLYELEDASSPAQYRLAMATENWDMPVIVTTAVQFFESFYSNRSSKCRKLHSLANSVIIFDEAQMLPTCHLQPCVGAIAELVRHFGATAVLCTATQPSLDDLLRTYAPDCPVTELCPQTAALYDRFRRVTFQHSGTMTDEVLAERLSEQRQVLCIVNSRKAAQSIYALLPQEGSYHLSTLMVPAQRQVLLDKIKERLRRGEPCRVVSTSLIEAGVDVDFPAVYRELAGLDSVMQAAGRCNREGKRPADESFVTIFERTELPPQLFQAAVGAAREALKEDRDPAAPETMTRYFCSLRDLSGDALDRQGVIEAFTQGIGGCEFPFRTVAEKFHLIDRNTYTIYIPYGEGTALLRRLQDGECSRDLYRKLGRYAVSVYDKHYQALYNAGALLTAREVPVLDEDSAILTDLTLYSETMGLSLEPETGKAEFI